MQSTPNRSILTSRFFEATLINKLLYSTIAISSLCVLGGFLYKDRNRRVAPPDTLRPWIRLVNLVGDAWLALTGRHLFSIPKDLLDPALLLSADDENLLGANTNRDILVPIRIIVSSMESPRCRLTPFGRYAYMVNVLKQLRTRREVLDYIRQTGIVINGNSTVVQPLIILGLPRSGSTLIQRLLAQDPGVRALHMWELFTPIPPPTSQELEEVQNDPKKTNSKIDLFDKGQVKLASAIDPNYFRNLSAVHHYDVREVEEETVLMLHCGMNWAVCHLLQGPYLDWVLSEDGKHHIYSYLRLALEMYGRSAPPAKGKHFVLKSPNHTFYPAELMKTFPDARVVICHRDPCNVVASFAKLVTALGTHQFFESSSRLAGLSASGETVGKSVLEHCSVAATRLDRYRATLPESPTSTSSQPTQAQFFDVYYDDLIQDPIAMVQKIYTHFDLELTSQAQEAMRKYLADHPQGKHGKLVYNLRDLGLTEGDVDNAFASYLATHPQLRRRR